jgi:type IV pilus assembly protein PilQ
MDLAINQDSVGSTLANGEISINTNQLTTSVVVNDGDTIVLGGVFRTEASDGVQKVPGLGDLPVIGAAFRNRQTTEQKNELLIFITPKLIRESLNVR